MGTVSDPKFEELRRKAEELLQYRPYAVPATSGNMLELIHELAVHQTELQIQNEELKTAQQELSDLYRKYSDLYEFAPCGYVTLNAERIITQANLAAADLIGTTRKVFLQGGFSRFIAEDRLTCYHESLQKAGETGKKQCVELRLKKKDGTSVWAGADIEADRDRDNSVVQWRMTLTDITEKKNYTERLEETVGLRTAELRKNAERLEVLIRELFHRTKNNMMAIISMLTMQFKDIGDDRVSGMIAETVSRIHSMALVHRKLYQSNDLSNIRFDEYIADLVRSLADSYDTGRIVLETDLEETTLLLDVAVPCGLILNELVTNSLKHAFPGNRGGEIRIRLKVVGENRDILLEVSDNGVGPPDGFDFRKTTTMGTVLVLGLGERQLRGKVAFESTGEGLAVQIRFNPKNLYRERV